LLVEGPGGGVMTVEGEHLLTVLRSREQLF
jgi:hypothetical protein